MISQRIEQFGRPLAKVMRDTPSPHGTEVIIRVGHCGVCHSDIHLQDGHFDLGGGATVDLTRSVAPPRTPGHEIAGTVVAIGRDARDVQIGQQRVVYPWIGCGGCAVCLGGQEQMCPNPAALGVNRDGGFATHVVVPHPRYLIDFAPLAEEQACVYACSGLTAYGALKKLGGLAADAPLLIIGAGGVGLSGIRLARHLFGQSPWVAEPDRTRWPLVHEAGAGEVIDPHAEGALRSLQKATLGGVAAAVDFVGSADSFSFGLGALRKGGTLVNVGLFGGSAPVSPAMLVLKAVTLIGSYVGSLSDMHELMALARSGALPPMPLNVRGLAQAQQAMDDLRAGRVHGRTVLSARDTGQPGG
jgi:D-arabinose 1-dehydrogenase-like Zn-dependent alcohol dehydrogenase